MAFHTVHLLVTVQVPISLEAEDVPENLHVELNSSTDGEVLRVVDLSDATVAIVGYPAEDKIKLFGPYSDKEEAAASHQDDGNAIIAYLERPKGWNN